MAKKSNPKSNGKVPKKKAAKKVKRAKKPNGQKHRSRTAGLMPPWKPGQSGNPGGKQRGPSVTALLHKALAEAEGDGTGRTGIQVIVDELIKRAKLGGDKHAIDKILERIDPVKSKAEVEVSGGIVIQMFQVDPEKV